MIIADVEAPGGERAKVLDFGIAKLEGGTQGMVRTRTNMMMGTPVYMAPEQCRGLKTITDRADVYSLAVMMFEMLTSRPPFQSEAPGDLMAMHMLQPPPSLREFIPDVDPVLQRLIEAMLGKDPQTRPSMTEVAQQLKALGNLQSDVMPMRVLRDSIGEGRPSMPVVPISQWQVNQPGPKSEPPPPVKPPPPKPPAAPRPAQHTDPDATVQMRDNAGLAKLVGFQFVGMAAQKAKALATRIARPSQTLPKPVDSQWQAVQLADATSQIPAEEPRTLTTKSPRLLTQKHLELLVLLGLLAVAILIGVLVLLIGGHGEGAH